MKAWAVYFRVEGDCRWCRVVFEDAADADYFVENIWTEKPDVIEVRAPRMVTLAPTPADSRQGG